MLHRPIFSSMVASHVRWGNTCFDDQFCAAKGVGDSGRIWPENRFLSRSLLSSRS
jgi:hypothetical protein